MGKIAWIDSHTHLADEAFDQDRDEIIQRLHDLNVKHVNLIGESVVALQKSLEIAHQDTIFDVSCGLHPADLESYSQEDQKMMKAMASDPRIVAVGEIGLDYHWSPQTKELQKQVFIEQIQLANQVKKPIIIHTREAMQDTYELLKQHRPEFGCVIHAYSGSWEMAQLFLNLGFYLSLGGVVTFKNARDVKKVAELVPLDRLLIETDAPYLTPHPYRGQRNQSPYVVLVGEEIARLKHVSNEIIQEAVYKNYRRLFQKEQLENSKGDMHEN